MMRLIEAIISSIEGSDGDLAFSGMEANQEGLGTPSNLGKTARICQRNCPAPAASLGKTAAEPDPFVFHLLVVLLHVIEPNREVQLGSDQPSDGRRQVEFRKSRIVLRGH